MSDCESGIHWARACFQPPASLEATVATVVSPPPPAGLTSISHCAAATCFAWAIRGPPGDQAGRCEDCAELVMFLGGPPLRRSRTKMSLGPVKPQFEAAHRA